MRNLSISLAAVAALALSSTFAATQAATNKPPHASTTGLMNRAPEASRHGANQPHFCPPGQAKKPGKGSAFHC
jgi:hypothetical protein